jgi:N-dimethylarginine dimethylaminohydrolase
VAAVVTTGLSEYGRLSSVLVKHAREAFVSQEQIGRQWKQLNFSAAPDFSRALAEYDRFLEVIALSGATIVRLPRHDDVSLDSIYTRDASIVGPAGMIVCRMGKKARDAEPSVQEEYLRSQGWPIAGSVAGPGLLEGGDLIWLDDGTVAVGEGRRTNAEGIRQLTQLLGGSSDAVIVVRLPEYPGQHDVMHLMSLISPIDRDLAVVSGRLLPSAFRRTLLDRGYRLVEVPDDEFETMGTNVLAIAPRECVMLNGNPRTRRALEAAGAAVHVYDGDEISLKGGGGPTCLTRPLARAE